MPETTGVEPNSQRITQNNSKPTHTTNYTDVLNHPRFTLARNHYMRVMITAHAGDPVMEHFSHEIGRVVLFNIILGHHARVQNDPTSPPLTIGRLRDLFLPFRLASSRSFDQMIARMQVIGLVTIEPIPDDRRRKLITPTKRMIEEDLTWLADHMSPLAVLYPDSQDYEPARLRDTRYQRAQRIISTANYHNSHDILDVSNPVLALMQRQDACKILYSYMLQAEASGTPLLASLTYEAVASRTSTSRTHVRNYLRDMEQLGMVRIHGKGGSAIELTAQIWEMVNVFLAKSMWGHDMVWQAAKHMIEAEDDAVDAKLSTTYQPLSA